MTGLGVAAAAGSAMATRATDAPTAAAVSLAMNGLRTGALCGLHPAHRSPVNCSHGPAGGRLAMSGASPPFSAVTIRPLAPAVIITSAVVALANSSHGPKEVRSAVSGPAPLLLLTYRPKALSCRAKVPLAPGTIRNGTRPFV